MRKDLALRRNAYRDSKLQLSQGTKKGFINLDVHAVAKLVHLFNEF
jgi:hypothetical protein